MTCVHDLYDIYVLSLTPNSHSGEVSQWVGMRGYGEPSLGCSTASNSYGSQARNHSLSPRSLCCTAESQRAHIKVKRLFCSEYGDSLGGVEQSQVQSSSGDIQ